MTRQRLAALAAALGLVAATVVPTAASAAEEPGAPAVRWAVTPADESGSDDRFSIQHALDAGESVTDFISVQNLGVEEAAFSLSAADGFTTRSGRFDMLASDKESVDAGTWVEIADEVTIAGGDSSVVPFTITVPEQAEPGDHPAGVAASVITTQSSGDGASLGVESRVGVKLITRVKGELTPALEVSGVEATYHGTWNPLSPGEVTATFELTNAGNTRLTVAGIASAGTGEIAFPADGDPVGDLLPGDTREVTVAIDGTWPTFYAPGELVVTPAAEAMDGTTPEADAVTVDLGAWAMPWSQLLVLLALALIIAALTWNRRRGRRRMEELLQQAREEGRRTAESGDASAPMRMRRRHRLAMLAALVLAAFASAPGAAVAATEADDDADGVSVHVNITELDDGGVDPGADGQTEPGDDGETDPGVGDDTATDAGVGTDTTDDASTDADDSGDDLPTTGLDLSLTIALGAAGIAACAAGVHFFRRRTVR